MIRCQMNCADNNCSRPRSSEEERMLRDGLITDAVLKRWELTLGLKDTHKICICRNGQTVSPGKWNFMGNGGYQRASPNESGNELHAKRLREGCGPKQRLGCKGL